MNVSIKDNPSNTEVVLQCSEGSQIASHSAAQSVSSATLSAFKPSAETFLASLAQESTESSSSFPSSAMADLDGVNLLHNFASGNNSQQQYAAPVLSCVNPGRKFSRVWCYFTMINSYNYTCKLCHFVGTYTNTTNMRKHIQHHHPERYQDILDHTRPTSRSQMTHQQFYNNLVDQQQQQQHSTTENMATGFSFNNYMQIQQQFPNTHTFESANLLKNEDVKPILAGNSFPMHNQQSLRRGHSGCSQGDVQSMISKVPSHKSTNGNESTLDSAISGKKDSYLHYPCKFKSSVSIERVRPGVSTQNTYSFNKNTETNTAVQPGNTDKEPKCNHSESKLGKNL